MSQSVWTVSLLLAATLGLPCSAPAMAAQTPAGPQTSATTEPPLTPAAQGYAEFELGKFAELQAETHNGGNYVQQALQHYTAAMAANPQSAYIAAQMADLLSRIGRDNDAITLVKSVIEKHPDSLAAHQTLGEIYLRQLSQARQPISGDTIEAAIAEYKTLIQLDPGTVGNQVILGKLYGAEGQPAEAEREFRAALSKDPSSMDAMASLIQSLASQDRLDQARQEIGALPPAARSGAVYATLGDAYLNKHQYKEAADAFRNAVQARPDDPDFQGALAQALLDGGNLPEALAEYQRLRRETPEDGNAALRTAQIQMQLGQLDAAAASLKDASGLLPSDDIEVAYATAMLHESQGNDAAALDGLRTLAARKNSPRTQSIFLEQLARIQTRTGDYDGAMASVGQLRSLGPAYTARANSLEIQVYSEQRDFTKALAAAKSALAAQPASRPLELTYANLLAASGQSSAAVAYLEPLLKGSSGDWDLYLAMGQIHQSAGQLTEALRDTARADQLAATPADHARAVAQQGGIQARQKQYAAAEQSYRHALDLAPGDPATLNAYGYLLAQQGVRLPEALDYVKQAIAHDSNNGAYLDSLGWVYFKMNRLPEAVASLERAASLQRHDPAILDHLAQAYDRDGKLQQAESSWTQALADIKAAPSADSERTLQIEKNLSAVRTKLAQSVH